MKQTVKKEANQEKDPLKEKPQKVVLVVQEMLPNHKIVQGPHVQVIANKMLQNLGFKK